MVCGRWQWRQADQARQVHCLCGDKVTSLYPRVTSPHPSLPPPSLVTTTSAVPLPPSGSLRPRVQRRACQCSAAPIPSLLPSSRGAGKPSQSQMDSISANHRVVPQLKVSVPADFPSMDPSIGAPDPLNPNNLPCSKTPAPLPLREGSARGPPRRSSLEV